MHISLMYVLVVMVVALCMLNNHAHAVDYVTTTYPTTTESTLSFQAVTTSTPNPSCNTLVIDSSGARTEYRCGYSLMIDQLSKLPNITSISYVVYAWESTWRQIGTISAQDLATNTTNDVFTHKFVVDQSPATYYEMAFTVHFDIDSAERAAIVAADYTTSPLTLNFFNETAGAIAPLTEIGTTQLFFTNPYPVASTAIPGDGSTTPVGTGVDQLYTKFTTFGNPSLSPFGDTWPGIKFPSSFTSGDFKMFFSIVLPVDATTSNGEHIGTALTNPLIGAKKMLNALEITASYPTMFGPVEEDEGCTINNLAFPTQTAYASLFINFTTTEEALENYKLLWSAPHWYIQCNQVSLFVPNQFTTFGITTLNTTQITVQFLTDPTSPDLFSETTTTPFNITKQLLPQYSLSGTTPTIHTLGPAWRRDLNYTEIGVAQALGVISPTFENGAYNSAANATLDEHDYLYCLAQIQHNVQNQHAFSLEVFGFHVNATEVEVQVVPFADRPPGYTPSTRSPTATPPFGQTFTMSPYGGLRNTITMNSTSDIVYAGTGRTSGAVQAVGSDGKWYASFGNLDSLHNNPKASSYSAPFHFNAIFRIPGRFDRTVDTAGCNLHLSTRFRNPFSGKTNTAENWTTIPMAMSSAQLFAARTAGGAHPIDISVIRANGKSVRIVVENPAMHDVESISLFAPFGHYFTSSIAPYPDDYSQYTRSRIACQGSTACSGGYIPWEGMGRTDVWLNNATAPRIEIDLYGLALVPQPTHAGWAPAETLYGKPLGLPLRKTIAVSYQLVAKDSLATLSGDVMSLLSTSQRVVSENIALTTTLDSTGFPFSINGTPIVSDQFSLLSNQEIQPKKPKKPKVEDTSSNTVPIILGVCIPSAIIIQIGVIGWCCSRKKESPAAKTEEHIPATEMAGPTAD